MDSANYKHIVAQIKKSSLLPHHIYPGYNLISIDNLHQLSDENNFPESVPCYVPFEYEVKSNLVFLPGSNPVDDATNLVKRKLKWEKKFSSMKLYNLNSVIKALEGIRRNKQKKLSIEVRKYIQHFNDDPEPYFNGSYNWLYTGGSITSVKENNETALICADYSGKKPGFCVVKLSENLDKVEYKSFYQLKTFSPILQITGRANPQGLLVCVRQKNQVSVFRIDGVSVLTNPTKLWRKKVVNDKIITSTDITANCELAAITDTNYDIHVIDIESGAKTLGYVGKNFIPETVPDRWGQVSLEDLGLFVAFRNSLHVLDLRDPDEGPKLSFDPSTSINSCEGICNMVKCTNSNYMYLATTHNLLQIDLRNNKPVQKWTHLMNYPPQFGSSVQSGEQELLILQSWKLDEMVGVTNNLVANQCFLSKSLPCLLRSVKESLRLMRCQAKCLNPLLPKRINFAVTGINCLKSNQGEVFMFAQNSGGDVFLNRIKNKFDDGGVNVGGEEEKELESMKAFDSYLEESLPKTICKSPEKFDMSHVLEGVELSEGKERQWQTPETYWKFHKMYAPENLSTCRDFLSQSFLKVWGYETVESDQEVEIPTPNEKILEWMEKI